MAALENRRHECFAVLLATMKPAAEAYLMAGYAEGSSYKDNARKLANRPAIKARVAELQGQVADKLVEVSAEWIEERLVKIADIEVTDAKAGEVISALRELGKFKGFYAPEKLEANGAITVQIIRFADDDDPPAS